jgi:protocatechuate 3,4-dioxygenase beta subunit
VRNNERAMLSRRDFLRVSLAASTPLVFGLGCGRELSASASPASAQARNLSPTPEYADDDDVTPSQTEGPYFTPSSPERGSLLEPGISGTRIAVAGHVLTVDCQPVTGALLDFWQADDGGVYDNLGYRLRGHQFTDEAGRYFLESVVPGLYPGRTRHFHVKVQAPNRPVLTTQLYFPDEPRNQRDGIFHPALLLTDVQDTVDRSKLARFDFVLDIG